MGQKPSQFPARRKSRIPLFWLLRFQKSSNPSPEQPIRFQYKTRRKNGDQLDKETSQKTTENNCNNLSNVVKSPIRDVKTINSVNNNIGCKTNQNALTIIKNTNLSEVQCKIVKTQNSTPLRTKSEPNLIVEKKEKRYRRKSTRLKLENTKQLQQFGYEIEDVDEFLTKVRRYLIL